MFGRSTKSAAGGETQTPSSARKSPMPASLLASDLVISGDLSSDGDLHIDGTVRGDVKAVRVTLGEGGQILGDIRAETIEVRGRIQGSIIAQQVRLAPSAHVEGDITHDQLTIEAGAYFQGRSLKQAEPASADLIMIAAAGARQA